MKNENLKEALEKAAEALEAERDELTERLDEAEADEAESLTERIKDFNHEIFNLRKAAKKYA